ncbi:MAG: hypothetical protein ACYSYL_04985 [Planctomycetota bacterium]
MGDTAVRLGGADEPYGHGMAFRATVPADRPPAELLQLLEGWKYRAYGKTATASSTYRGPPGVLIDGLLGPEFWQTKNVPFPQWCTVDIGQIMSLPPVWTTKPLKSSREKRE